ncbi:MAG: transposase, partial [Thiotrichaceae bacterium]|nr:transposase [Thiotrichaceae bacterium]
LIAQYRLVFLPAYSPDLNPIENCWAIIKARLKKIGKQFDNFNCALDYVLSVYFLKFKYYNCLKIK